MLGGVYEDTIDKEGGNTIDECRRKAHIKYKKAVDGMYSVIKKKYWNSSISNQISHYSC
jgi:hypothetical protein